MKSNDFSKSSRTDYPAKRLLAYPHLGMRRSDVKCRNCCRRGGRVRYWWTVAHKGRQKQPFLAPFHTGLPDHYGRLSSLFDQSVSQSGRLITRKNHQWKERRMHQNAGAAPNTGGSFL
ncbi:hypothetical protein Tco_0186769, partial [Tanacetum coccineum]